MGHIAHRGELGAILVPREIFRDPRLTGNERLLLCTLFEFADNETGKCNPSGQTIEELSGIAARNIKPVADTLVAKGWLGVVGGSTRRTNDYTVRIPVPDETWGYTYATDKRLTAEGWAAKQAANERRRKEGILSKKIRMGTFFYMRPDELEKELADEIELGRQWIPDGVLENFAMVRGGDNSEDAREFRRGAGGVIDPFEECGGAAEVPRPAGNFANLSRDQLLDYGFRHGADAIDAATLRKAGLSRDIFPE